MHDLVHKFTSRKVSPWGGLKFFYRTYAQSGLRTFLEELDLPFPGSNRGYNPVELIEGFLASVVLGARRLEHSGMLRTELEGSKDEQEVPYIIRARMTARMRDAITQLTDWYACDDVQPNACYQEFYYQAASWHKARRIIVVRTPREGADKHPIKTQGFLFESKADWQRYDYKAYVTNTGGSAASLHRRYNQRADCESRIKELKYDYGIDGFSLQSFAAMEAAFQVFYCMIWDEPKICIKYFAQIEEPDLNKVDIFQH